MSIYEIESNLTIISYLGWKIN